MCECSVPAEEFIKNSFSPKVAVLCSQDADTVCWKNNLSFTELLQPFCRLSNEVQMKDPASQSYSLKNFQIVISNMMEEPPAFQIGKKILSDAVANSIKNYNKLVSLEEDPITMSAPWYEIWRETMLKIMPLSNHEFINHFVAVIYVVSTNNEDPLEEFKKLSQFQYKSQFQNTGLYPKWFSRDILKHHVLIHDCDSSTYRNEEIYQHLITTYGSHTCHFLSINSRPANEHQSIKDFWSPFVLRLQTSIHAAGQEDISDSSADYPQAYCDSLPNKVITEVPMHHTDSQVSLYNMDQATMSTDFSESDSTYLSVLSEDIGKNIDLGPLGPNNLLNCPGSPPSKEGTSQPGSLLTSSDIDRLQTFVYEFVVRSLVPFIEKQIRHLNDLVAQRKGIHRSLFSATKRIFSSGKPVHSMTSNSQYVIDAPELQVRRLADLAFMFQNYELAYQCYHMARKDFGNDQAWPYFAGASEMAALSIFMLGSLSQRSFPYHYLDDAIKTYLGQAKMPMLAVRSVVLSTEATKSLKSYRDAALYFVKLTAEDSDLRSALFLEQAAYCYLRCEPSAIRKYAFHIVLAGHRYSKAFQRKLSLRCYQQALQVYQISKLSMATDHIQYSIGRHSRLLGHLRDAYHAYHELMTHDSAQPYLQQFLYIKEFIDIIKVVQQQDPEYFEGCLPSVPVPFIAENSIKTMLSLPPCPPPTGYQPANHMMPIENPDVIQRIEKLEELLFSICKQPTVFFKPTNHILTSKTLNKIQPTAYVGEPIYVEMEIRNTYKVCLLLENINLMWTFTPTEDPSLTLSNDSEKRFLELNPFIVAYPYKHLNMEPFSIHKVVVGLIPKSTGNLNIEGLGFYLSCSVPKSYESVGEEESSSVLLSKQIFKVRGPRLNKTKVEKMNVMYGDDYRLQPIIAPSMPCLQAFFEMPSSQHYYCGEVKHIRVQLTNCGQVGLANLHVAFSDPKHICFGNGMETHDVESLKHVYFPNRSSSNQSVPVQVTDELEVCSHVAKVQLPDYCKGHIMPGQSVLLSLWVHAPFEKGLKSIEMLFYYESTEEQQNTKKSYRVLRHILELNVLESINVSATSWRSFPIIKGNENLEDYNIVMEIENVARKTPESKHSFQLLQVSGSSPKLQVTSDYPLKAVALLTNQKSTYSFKARELTGCSGDCRVFSDISCGEKLVSSCKPPCRMFCERHTWNLVDLMELDDKSQEASDKLNINKEILPVKEAVNFDLIIIVLWEGTCYINDVPEKVYGQHHIHLQEINHVYSSTSGLVSSSKPLTFTGIPKTVDLKPDHLFKELVKFTMNHKARLDHNFYKHRLCIIPVALTLHNCSGIAVLTIIDAGIPCTPVNNSSEDVECLQPFQKFLWVGTNSIQIMLKPKETKTLSLKAALTHAGTYNLGLVQVSCHIPGLMKEKEFVLQNQQVESVILVNSVNR